MVQIEIKSRPGKFFTVDDDVAEKIGGWGWYTHSNGYLCARLPGHRVENKRVLLSRAVIWVITGEWPPAGMDVDHINHDLFDNRIENLRVVTKSFNQRNRVHRKGGKSKYKGVQCKEGVGWQGRSHFSAGGIEKSVISSMAKDEDTAARARDCIVDLIGGFKLPNFPGESFAEKWERIGEKQRAQILHSLEKHGFTSERLKHLTKGE
jgi:hypothetical protein